MYNQAFQGPGQSFQGQGQAVAGGGSLVGHQLLIQQKLASDCNTPAVPTLVADTARDINDRARHLHGLVDRIERVARRIFGASPPEATEPPEATAGPNSIEQDCDLARLQSSKMLLDLAIERLEHQVRRVEQF